VIVFQSNTIFTTYDMEQKIAFNTKIELPSVRNIIVIASGKGGVGKSTIAANLAIALSNTGVSTALVDADIYGPSIPLMFNVVNEKPLEQEINDKKVIMPVKRYGISLLSIGFFIDSEKAAVWRGPMASKVLIQLLEDTHWGEVDYMIIDLPPGTSDIQLTIAQKLQVTGAIIVTTPQNVALASVKKAIEMFYQDKIKIPVKGIVENMSYFSSMEFHNKKYNIFGEGGGEKISKEFNIPLLEKIPIDRKICESGDLGHSIALKNEGVFSLLFNELAIKIIEQIKEVKYNINP